MRYKKKMIKTTIQSLKCPKCKEFIHLCKCSRSKEINTICEKLTEINNER